MIIYNIIYINYILYIVGGKVLYKKYVIFAFLLLLIIPLSFAADNETALTVDSDDSLVVPNSEDVLKASNDYYFNASAETDGNGSLDNPFKYLTADRIKANCNIHLSNGEYQLDKAKSIDKVNIYGSDVEKTIIQYNGIGFTVSSSLTIQNVTFTDMSITNYGDITANNTVFSYGSGSKPDDYGNNFGGAIYSHESYPNAHVTLNNCTFEHNFAVYGGAIYMGNGYLEVIDTIFNSNMAYNYGGAIACEKAKNVTISKSKFYNSISVDDAGGAIYLRLSPFTGKSIEFVNSSSTFGSAITSLNSAVSIANANFENNSAKWDGGAVYHMYGDFTLTGSKFTNNSARNGGALFIDNSTSLYMRSNIFTNNTASYAAGAIYSLLNKLKSPIEPYNIFKDNFAYYMDDIFDTSQLNLTIGNGNYSMYKANPVEIEVLPSKYNLIDEGYTTPVKNQESGGNCWAFAAIAVIESCILKANGTSIDLSEENMKNLMALYSDYGWNYDVNSGGNDYLVRGYLTSWLGPVLEIDDLHDDNSAVSPVIDSILHIQNILFLKRDNFTENDAIKKALMQYGAVSTSFAFYYSYLRNNNYYCYNVMDCNHAVTIVGWDDNYSKSNFYRGSSIEGDGAWIVKNSWGPNWGNKGYFYVSYYDKNFARPGVSDASYTIIFNDTIKYDKNYQYDISGMSDYFLNSSSSVWYKNMFEATDDEYLAAVSTYFEKNTNWTAYIYVNDELKLVKEGKSNPGYYTIDLNRLIPLNIGDVFEVVFNIKVDSEAAFPISEATNFNKLIYKPGISYMSYDGENWQDLFELSWTYPGHYYLSQVACIKAFTVLDEIKTTLNLTVEFNNQNPANITAKVLDQYGNPLKSGEVTFNVNNDYYSVNVVDGIALLHYAFSEVFNNIYALFESDGYISSQNYTDFFIEKYKLGIDFNITQKLNNIVLDIIAMDKINNTAKLFINEQEYIITFADGKYSLNLTELENGIYNLTLDITFPFESIYENNTVNGTFVIDMKNSKILAGDLLITDEDEMNYTVFLFDENDNPLLNKTLEVILNGEIYNLTTDGDGRAVMPLNLNPGSYNVDINFKGDNNYFNSNATSNIVLKRHVLIDLGIDKVRNNITLNINISKQINDTLTVVINNKTEIIEVKNGTSSLNLINLDNDVYNVTVDINGLFYVYDNDSTGFIVDVRRTQIIADDAVISDEGQNYTVLLVDEFNNTLSNKSVELVVDGMTYNAFTDINGQAVFLVELNVGDYVSAINFNGDNDYIESDSSSNFKVKTKVDINLTSVVTQNNVLVSINISKMITDYLTLIINNDTTTVKVINGMARHRLFNLENGIYNLSVNLNNDIYMYNEVLSEFEIDVIHTQILAEDLITDDESTLNYTIYLMGNDGNPVLNKSFEINMNGSYYNQKTDDDGKIILPLNLKSGIYALNIAFKGDDKYIGSNNSTTIKVKTKVNLGMEIDKFANNVTLTFNLSKAVNDTLNVVINDDSYLVGVVDGVGYLSFFDLVNGVYDVSVNLDEDDYEFDVAEAQFVIDMKEINILCDDIVINDEDYFIYNVTLIDGNNQLIVGKEAEIILDGAVINNKTDSNGQIFIPINLTSGIYTLTVNVAGDDSYFKNTSSSVINVKSKVVIDLSIDKFANNVTLAFNLSKAVNDTLTVGINIDSYGVGVVDGVGYLTLFDLVNGIYVVNVGLDDNIYDFNAVSGQFVVDVRKTEIIMDDLFINDEDFINYTISLIDEDLNSIKNRSIIINLNGTVYNLFTDMNGQVVIPVNLKPGNYEVTTEFMGDDSYFKSSSSSVVKVKSKVTINLNWNMFLNNVDLVFNMSKAVNDTLTINLNNNSYVVSVVDGVGRLSLFDLANGVYDVNAALDDKVYDYDTVRDKFVVDVKETVILLDDLVINDEDFINYTISLTDGEGDALLNRSVALTIGGQFYNLTTDSNGQVIIPVNLKPGSYEVKAEFMGDDSYFKSMNSSVINVKSKVVIFLNRSISLNNVDLVFNLSKAVNDTLTINLNNNSYVVSVVDGVGCLSLFDLANGVYDVNAALDDKVYDYDTVSDKFVVDVKETVILLDDLVINDEDFINYAISLTDGEGDALLNRSVALTIGEQYYNLTTDSNGQVIIPVNLKPGSYEVKAEFMGDDSHFKTSNVSSINVKCKVSIDLSIEKSANNLSMTIDLSKSINDTLTVVINNKTYEITVDDNQASLSLSNLENSVYDVYISLDEDFYDFNHIESQFIIDFKQSRIIANDLTVTENELAIFNITLIDENSNPVTNRSVEFNLNGKDYIKTTDMNGKASLLVYLSEGIYDIISQFRGDDNYSKFSITNKIMVEALKNTTASPDNFITDTIIKLNSSFPNETFVVTINDKIYSVDVNNFTEALPLNNISNGIYDVTISLNDTDDPYFKNITSQFVIDIKDSKIISADLTAYHNYKSTYSIILTDLDGNALAGKLVAFDLNGVRTSVLSDGYGQAIFEFELPVGTYYINVSYSGDVYQYYSSSVSNLIIVKSAIVEIDSTTKTYNSKYMVKFLDNAGNPLRNSNVVYTIDDVTYVKSTDAQGYLSADILQTPGNHTLTLTNPINNETLTKNISVIPRIAQNNNLVMYEYAGKYYKVLVLDDNGNPVKSGEIVQMILNGKTYNVKTNVDGYASLKVNLKNKVYTITTKYKGYSVSNKITVKPVLITKNVAVKYGKKITFKVKLLDKKGKILKNKKITFKFRGKKYIVKTNKKGYATLTLKLKLRAGNYKIYTSYGKSKATNKITIKK